MYHTSAKPGFLDDYDTTYPDVWKYRTPELESDPFKIPSYIGSNHYVRYVHKTPDLSHLRFPLLQRPDLM